jgi:GT2 family glycosyltransferase
MPTVDPRTPPRVSVVCPAYHSYDTIEASLRAIEAQTYRDLEVIVVNSSPETRTQELLTARFPSVRFIQSPVRLYPHAARNRGVADAAGEILAFTDPDCITAADWLEKLVAGIDRGCGIALGGMGVIEPTGRETAIHLQKFHWCLAGAPAGERSDLATANACLTREVWRRAGPFDADLFCGDSLLAWRAKRAGFRIGFVPDAVVLHHHGQTVGRFARERMTRGEEFARTRADWHGWSRAKSLLRLLATPATLVLVSARAVRDGVTAGYGLRSITTLPFQLLGHASWLVGEARSHLARFRKARPTA